jgi:rhamnosyl/mannosyltransferase
MRILHVYKDYYPVWGGIENHVRALAEAQVQRGHTVTVLVTNPGRATVEETLNGVRVIKAGRIATVASTPLSPDLPRILQQLQPDVTHIQSPYPVGEVAQWQAGPQRPYVVSYQADVSRAVQRLVMLIYGPWFRRFLRRARRVITSNPNFAAHSRVLQSVADRVTIIPFGIDTDRFAPSPQRDSGRPFTALFVGQLRHYKGVDDLIRAMAHLPPSARLLIAGQGPRRADWEALSRALGLAGRVTFLGKVSDADLPALYRSADVLVLPSTSRAESFGIVLIEAMASGLPCLTTEIGSGNSYVVQHNVTGLVAPPRSPQALAEALSRLAADPALRAQMGQAGRARALREFPLEKMVERVESIYQSVWEFPAS